MVGNNYLEVLAMILGAFASAGAFLRWLIGVVREEFKESRATHEKVSADHRQTIADQLKQVNEDKMADRQVFADATKAFSAATDTFSEMSRDRKRTGTDG